MSTRSGRIRAPVKEISPPRTRKGVSPPRTPSKVPARVKSSPPARSPSRKSPSRKSPSRKPVSKFPARKSPSRTTKEAIENAAQKSPSKRAVKSEVSLNVNEVTTSKPEIYRATRSRRSEYSIRDLTGRSTEREDTVNGIDPLIHSNDLYGLRNRKSVEEIVPRRSSRLREFDLLPDIRRSQSKSASKSVSKSVSQSIDTYSDGDDSEQELRFKKSESVTRKLATPLRESISSKLSSGSRWEFGGRIGSAALIFLIPLTVFSILIPCRKACSVESLLNLAVYKSSSAWFSLTAFAVILSQYILQTVFTILQIFGPVKERLDDAGSTHTFNAFFSSFVTLNILYSLRYFGLFDDSLLVTNYVKLAVISYLFAVTLSVILFIKSRKLKDSDLNPYGNTGYTLYDFCMGREIHPFIMKLDVKLWISRISNINTLVLLIILFRQGFTLPQEENQDLTWENAKLVLSKVQVKPTVVLFAMMQIVYILNFIIKEYKITSTFFWQSEGLGYLQLVSSALYPFLFTTISKFIVDVDVKIPYNALISASVLYLIGLLIMMISNNIKHEFRRNPLQPGFSNLETMPTFHGKKLLVAGPWGVVRHPNYIGDILIHAALAIPGILTGRYIAAAPALLTILVLLHRAWRDHSRCKRRYGAAWERYSKKVPKIFIPKLV